MLRWPARHINSSLRSQRKPIMNSLKKLLSTKSLIAAAVAASGIAAPAVSHALTPIGGPASGVNCRAGYTGAFDGARLKCTKAVDITLELSCKNPTFPTYVTRAIVPPTGVGRDFCTRAGIFLGPTDSIVNLVLGQDYVHAEVDPAAVTTRTANQRQTEATALGLALSEVATVAGTPAIQLGGGVGNKDNAKVTLTHFTFAVPAGGVVINTGPVTSSTPFVPRPLP
jgi:hypothetical protein